MTQEATKKKTEDQRPIARLQRDEKGFYDIVELPSRGIPYGGELPQGTVEIYAMTAALQKQIASLARRSPTEVSDKIISSVLKTDFDTGKLTSADRLYIMLHARIISYPDSVKSLRVMNPETGNYFDAEIDLRKLEVRELPDDWKEPYEVTLPMSGDRVGVRAMRGEDELSISQQVKRDRMRSGRRRKGQKKETEYEDSSIFSLTLQKQVVTINGKEVSYREKEEWIDGLLAGDMDHLATFLIDFDGGIDFSCSVEDPDTGHMVEISLVSARHHFLDPT